MSDGVQKYRNNGRSVEGLTEDELGDILESFPRDSDAYMEASLQLESYWDLEQEYKQETD